MDYYRLRFSRLTAQRNVIIMHNHTITQKTDKVISCLLEDGSLTEIHVWEKDVFPGENPVLVVHDLWESLEDYEQDINWWLNMGRRVYGVQIRTNGSVRTEKFAGSFRMLCVNLLQVLARIRALEDMRAPIVYTKGLGGLMVSKIVRKNAKFVSCLICYGPMLATEIPVRPWQRLMIQSLSKMTPNLRVPQWLAPQMSEIIQAQKGLEREVGNLPALALYEYLRAMRQGQKLCARLKVPSYFIIPRHSEVLDYELLEIEDRKRGGSHEFQVHLTDDFIGLRSGALSDEDFDLWASKTLESWLSTWEQCPIKTLPTPTPSDNALSEDEKTASIIAPLPMSTLNPESESKIKAPAIETKESAS